MKTANYLDRSEWAPGPWDEEPFDHIEWVDEETGYECMMHRSPWGAWNAYVGLPEFHALYGTEWSDLPNLPYGGFTFSEEEVVEFQGDEEKLWWVGWDYMHGMDLAPGMAGHNNITDPENLLLYHPLVSVKAEVYDVCQALFEHENNLEW